LVYSAVVYGLGLVLTAGLIPQWGRWHSCSIHHRGQVEALLRGELALSRELSALAHDLTWSEGGVHQVWGLGVPLWRLPFEAAARLLGREGFPDMLALAAALGLAAWAVLRVLFGMAGTAAMPRPSHPIPAREPAMGDAIPQPGKDEFHESPSSRKPRKTEGLAPLVLPHRCILKATPES
jgi:hypothetical protein